jgi:hypothetical protein
MKRFASYITVAAVAASLIPSLAAAKDWRQVYPDGEALCRSDTPFQHASADPVTGKTAADYAKAAFCKLVLR